MRISAKTFPLVLPIVLVALAGCDSSSDKSDKTDKPPVAAPTTSATTPSGSPNGIEQLAAAEILDKARKATTAASSVHIAGKTREDGQLAEVDYKVSQQSAAGHLAFGGGTVDLVRVGNNFYVKGNREFWKSATDKKTTEAYIDKYLAFNENVQMFRGLIRQLSVGTLVEDITKPDATPTKGGVEQINGRRAIPLLDGDGKLYVAADGEPRILRISKKAQDVIEFTYDEPVNVTPPPADQIVKQQGPITPA